METQSVSDQPKVTLLVVRSWHGNPCVPQLAAQAMPMLQGVREVSGGPANGLWGKIPKLYELCCKHQGQMAPAPLFRALPLLRPLDFLPHRTSPPSTQEGCPPVTPALGAIHTLPGPPQSILNPV